MFETVVIATDGSESVQRGVRTAVDLAGRFDGTIHALYVTESDPIESSPAEIKDEIESALHEAGDAALSYVQDQAAKEELSVETAVREGHPAEEIMTYADSVDADVIAMGTRGRHGDHAFLLGSVAEAVVRHASQPVLTVRQLEESIE